MRLVRWQDGRVNSSRDSTERDSTAERARWVERYRASGLGLKRFAAKHRLLASQLHYWTYGSRAANAVAPAAPGVFQEVAVPGEWKSRPAWAVEIGLPEGITVRLDGRVDVRWVGSLLDCLRRPCSR